MTILSSLFERVGEQLDGIIDVYRREKPPHPETIVEYANGSISSFNIEGVLGQNSISDKTNAVKVDIGTAVTGIGTYAFQHCSSLTLIIIPNSVNIIRNSAFDYCSGLTSVTIPDSVTKIEAYAFKDCSGLTSIIIGSSITNIESQVFYKCFNLMSIKCLATIAPSITWNTFGSSYTTYTGRNSYSTGTNVLRIPIGATGYDSSYWLDPLQDATKCGFHIEYI